MITHQASIDYTALCKGQRIDGNIAWNFYAMLRPDRFECWMAEFGSEEIAKPARISQALMYVRDWIDKCRRHNQLPPLVITTGGGGLNVLDDEEASRYLSDLAFAGLRKHVRYTARLSSDVDESRLSQSSRREHERRVATHNFVAAATKGAQSQLRELRRHGRDAPRLKP